MALLLRPLVGRVLQPLKLARVAPIAQRLCPGSASALAGVPHRRHVQTQLPGKWRPSCATRTRFHSRALALAFVLFIEEVHIA